MLAGEIAQACIAEGGVDVGDQGGPEDQGVSLAVVVFGDNELRWVGLKGFDTTVDVVRCEAWLVGGDDEDTVFGGGGVLVLNVGEGEADGIDHVGLIVVVDDDCHVVRIGE